MRVVDPVGLSIDYRLNILGVRVWEDSCQLIARSGEGWSPIGPRWDLPVYLPQNPEELETAAADTLRLTAYQYSVEQAGSDLGAVMGRQKEFSAALLNASAEGT